MNCCKNASVRVIDVMYY